MQAEGDVYYLPLGGFVTSDNFIQHAAQAAIGQTAVSGISSRTAASSSHNAPSSRYTAPSSSHPALRGRQVAQKRKSSAIQLGGVQRNAPCRTSRDLDIGDNSGWHLPHTVYMYEQPHSASHYDVHLVLCCVSDFE